MPFMQFQSFWIEHAVMGAPLQSPLASMCPSPFCHLQDRPDTTIVKLPHLPRSVYIPAHYLCTGMIELQCTSSCAGFSRWPKTGPPKKPGRICWLGTSRVLERRCTLVPVVLLLCSVEAKLTPKCYKISIKPTWPFHFYYNDGSCNPSGCWR